MTPFVDGLPRVGFIVQIAPTLEGAIKEPSVSVPIETNARFAATATADPELEPDGSAPKLYAFLV